MIGALILSHGPMAEALIASVEILVGKLPQVRAISIWPKDPPAEVEERIRRELESLQDGAGVILFTDLLGGTPTNFSLPFLEGKDRIVITGVNVPMLLAFASYRSNIPLQKISALIRKAGRKGIRIAPTKPRWSLLGRKSQGLEKLPERRSEPDRLRFPWRKKIRARIIDENGHPKMEIL